MQVIVFGPKEAAKLVPNYTIDKTIENADNKKILMTLVDSELSANSHVKIFWTDFDNWSNSTIDFRKQKKDKSNKWFYQHYWTLSNKVQLNSAIIDYACLHIKSKNCTPYFYFMDDSIVNHVKDTSIYGSQHMEYIDV